jgi:hypothetical protein
LSALGYHEGRRRNRASQSRRRHQFNTFVRDKLAYNLASDLEALRRYARRHHCRRCDFNVLTNNLTFRWTLNFGESPELDISMNPGYSADAVRTCYFRVYRH